MKKRINIIIPSELIIKVKTKILQQQEKEGKFISFSFLIEKLLNLWLNEEESGNKK